MQERQVKNPVFKCVWPQYKHKTLFGKNLKRHDLIQTEEKKFKCYVENRNKEFKRKYCNLNSELVFRALLFF
jgi:hypothetical protein